MVTPSKDGSHGVCYCSPGQTRTADLVVNSHPLYQLSYRGMTKVKIVKSLLSVKWGEPGQTAGLMPAVLGLLAVDHLFGGLRSWGGLHYP